MEQSVEIIGIAARYNPFHNGHKFQVEEAKRRTGTDWCVAAMNDGFVQRGEPTVHNKCPRTRMVPSCGADLAAELPSAFAASSAENFAACSVALLTGPKAVDVLCFGGEDRNIRGIRTAVGILAQEGGDFPSLPSVGLRSGLSWSQTRSQAPPKMADRGKDFLPEREETGKLLGPPNNLLGIEYYKTILRQNDPLTLLTIHRRGQGHHDNGLGDGQASAPAIRWTLKVRVPSGKAGLFPYAKLTPEAMTHIPPEIQPLYGQEPVLGASNLSEVLNLCLPSLEQEGADYTQYRDMSVGMACQLDHCLLKQVSWEGHIEQLKTCQYTYIWLNHTLLHMVLGPADARVQPYREVDRTPYARILGFRKESQELLTLVEQKTAIPLITRAIDTPHILTEAALGIFSRDTYASHVRQTLLSKRLEQLVQNEYSHPVCIL